MDPENKYVNPALYHFANMVHSKTTGIGCAYKVCGGTRLTVMCLYNKIGYYTNSVMWEKGNACRSDTDCTTYPGSSCSEGLCVKELEKPDPGTNAMCPSNGNMTDAARRKFLDLHNFFRSRVAKGLEPDALGGNAPKASKMLKMVYDCDVEASAIRQSRKCVYGHSTPAERPGLRENIYMHRAGNGGRASRTMVSGPEKYKLAEELMKQAAQWILLITLR
ncbi:SCP-like protein [Cooperia oncophora]